MVTDQTLLFSVLVQIAIFVVCVVLSCTINYWRGSAIYYKIVAARNDKNFKTLFDLQGDGMFIAKKRCPDIKKSEETESLKVKVSKRSDRHSSESSK